jgi:ketopantoate reductase
MSTIGILGCGWLGVPLGKHLQQLDYTVKGSRTSESGVVELQKKGIEGYRVVLEEDQALGLDTRLCSKNPTTTGRLGLLSNSAYFIFE